MIIRQYMFVVAALWAMSLGARVEAQDPGAQAEARARFERGVALYDEGRLDAALAELEEAYRLAPHYAVHFNLGQVHARLGHAVEAVEAFERYLSEGGDRIPAERRARVEGELATQRERIASLVIEVNVEGASISVNGSVVARAPLSAPIRVAVGEQLVAVSAGGYEPQQRRVTVAGGVTETVRFTLAETGSARGTIRVTSALRDVEIRVDGEVVGRTPLDSSLSVPPGAREVRATRPGYRPFSQVVQVGMGAEAELRVELEPDLAATEALGTLQLRLPPGASVSIDGVAVDADRITLPVGDHELRAEMPDIQPFVQRLSIAASDVLELSPELRYTPSARAARQAGAASQQTAAVALAIAGGLLVAGGAGVVIWNEARRGELEFDQRRMLIPACRDMLAAPPEECFHPRVIPHDTPSGQYGVAILRAQEQFDADVDAYNALVALGYTLVGLGAASVLVSVLLFVTTPSDEETSTLRVGVGPGGVFATGRF